MRLNINIRDSVLIQQPDEIPEPDGTTDAGDLYFEVLELQPIRLSLSFMRTERVSSEEQYEIQKLTLELSTNVSVPGLASAIPSPSW